MQLATSRFLPHLDTRIVDIVAHEHGCLLAGGALRSIIDGTPIADYDLFFTHEQAAQGAKMRLKDLGAETVFVCPEGLLTTFKLDGIKIQCITETWYSDVEHVISTFDINACRFVFDGYRVYTTYSAVRDALKNQITLHRIEYPQATMKRIAKYIAKGYRLTNKAVDQYVDRVYTAGAENEFLDPRFYID